MNAPTIIHKHWIGIVVIAALTLLVAGGVAAFAVWLYSSGTLPFSFIMLCTSLAFMVLAWGAVTLYTYWLSTIVMSETGVTVDNWMSLFYDVDGECPYSQVQDVTFTRSGLFAYLFDYGTVLVQTAGTRTNFEMTMIPHPVALQHLLLDAKNASK